MPAAVFVTKRGFARTAGLVFVSALFVAYPIVLTAIIAATPETQSHVKRLVLSPESNLEMSIYFNDKLSFRLPTQVIVESDNKGKVSFADPDQKYIVETDINPNNDWIYKLLTDHHIPKMPIHDFYEYIFNSPIGYIPLQLKALMIHEIFKNGQLYELSHPAFKGYVVVRVDGDACRNMIQITTLSGSEVNITLTTLGCDLNFLQSFLSSVSYGRTQAEAQQ